MVEILIPIIPWSITMTHIVVSLILLDLILSLDVLASLLQLFTHDVNFISLLSIPVDRIGDLLLDIHRWAILVQLLSHTSSLLNGATHSLDLDICVAIR